MSLDFYSFLPVGTQEKCASLIADNNVHIKVVRQRKTKHGDFRVQHGKPVTITLNAMENRYRFCLLFCTNGLITACFLITRIDKNHMVQLGNQRFRSW